MSLPQSECLYVLLITLVQSMYVLSIEESRYQL